MTVPIGTDEPGGVGRDDSTGDAPDLGHPDASAAAPPGAAPPAGKGGKGLKSVRDMVLSMVVITLGALVLYATLPNDESQDPVREITYETELATAGRAAPYELLAPRGLGEKWRATSVSYRAQSDHGAVWHLGFMDPSNEYVAVEQGDGDERKFISKVTHGASETARSETINGEDWVRYEGEKYNALVLSKGDQNDGAQGDGPRSDAPADATDPDAARVDGPVTTVVTGTASHARLKQLAAALEPPPGG